MNRVRSLTRISLLCALAAVFQMSPLFLSDLFTPLTMLSGFILYFIVKDSPKSGSLAVMVIFAVTAIFYLHEAIFFIFTNAVVGYVLGVCRYYKVPFLLQALCLGFGLGISISLMNLIFGLNAIVWMPESQLYYYLAVIVVGLILAFPLTFLMALLDKRISKSLNNHGNS
jgi:hypothetical protein